MASRKSRPILYEVARHSRLSAEPSARRRPTAPPEQTARVTGTSKFAEAEPPEAEYRPGPPMVAVSQGRVRVAVGWTSGAVLVAGLIVLLVVTFQAGRRYAERTQTTVAPGTLAEGDENVHSLGAPDENGGNARESSRGKPTAAKDTRSRQTAGAPATKDETLRPAAAETRQVVLKKGYHYVVVQHFRKRESKAAEDAYVFLRSRGVDCALWYPKDIWLIVTTPFLINQEDAAARRREQQRAEGLRQRVKELGKEYARDLRRGYAFDQCYLYEVK